MINLSQIARHFSTDNDQKRSICPKLIAALAQAKSPPNHAPRKGIPGGCGNTPCPKSIATPVLAYPYRRKGLLLPPQAPDCWQQKAPETAKWQHVPLEEIEVAIIDVIGHTGN